MVSDASKKKAAQKKAAAAAKRGGKAAAASKSAGTSSNGVDTLSSGVEALQISDRTCTGILCSHPQSRDIRVSLFYLFIGVSVIRFRCLMVSLEVGCFLYLFVNDL